jgi:hypothetical protein
VLQRLGLSRGCPLGRFRSSNYSNANKVALNTMDGSDVEALTPQTVRIIQLLVNDIVHRQFHVG